MAIREILKFPDPRLREVSEEVRVFDKNVKMLTEDMLETMYEAHGIGLAAPQVGVTQRVLVIDTRPKEEGTHRYTYEGMTELEKKVKQPLVLVNPVIVSGEGQQTFDEGCLSVPSYYETVERYLRVVVRAQDIQGEEFEFETDGLLAVCIQHEMDHLEGKLFIDRISFLKSQKIKKQIKKNGYPKKKVNRKDTLSKEPASSSSKDPVR
jgi:peptide deformylase